MSNCISYPYQFIYKLGHQAELAIAEFQALLKREYLDTKSDLQANLVQTDISLSKKFEIYRESKSKAQFIFCNQDINLDYSGSLVWKGQILKQIQNLTKFKKTNLSSDTGLDLAIAEQPNLVSKHDLDANLLQEVQTALLNPNWFQTTGQHKTRLGLIGLNKTVLPLVKKLSYKKIKLLDNVNHFNYGHWRATKNWLVLLPLETKNLHGWLLVRILQLADPTIWTLLDKNLPAQSMRRGLLNLKLGRSLLNLASGQNIWDPFAGAGRLAISALDMGKNFILTDIDSTCQTDIYQNWQYAQKVWQKYSKAKASKNLKQEISKEGLEKEEKVVSTVNSNFCQKELPTVNEHNLTSISGYLDTYHSNSTPKEQNSTPKEQFFSTNHCKFPTEDIVWSRLLLVQTLDAQELENLNLQALNLYTQQEKLKEQKELKQKELTSIKSTKDKLFYSQLAIVTEGTLGTNFTSTPSLAQMRQEWTKLESLWQKVLKKAGSLGIPELIFCLPFYRKRIKLRPKKHNRHLEINSHINKVTKDYLPPFLSTLTKETSYRFVTFGKTNYLKYARPQAHTGHLICKLVQVDKSCSQDKEKKSNKSDGIANFST